MNAKELEIYRKLNEVCDLARETFPKGQALRIINRCNKVQVAVKRPPRIEPEMFDAANTKRECARAAIFRMEGLMVGTMQHLGCVIDFLEQGERVVIEGKDIVAQLEKQKENPKSSDSIPADCVSDAKCGNSWYKVGDPLEGKKRADEVLAYLIKSGYRPILKDNLDQKHFQIKIPRHKEDFFQSTEYKHCREILDEYYYEGDFAGDVYTLYVLRQKEQKPAEWSEEDWDRYDCIIDVLKNAIVDPRYNEIGHQEIVKAIQWLERRKREGRL